jgi:hypothetical protein
MSMEVVSMEVVAEGHRSEAELGHTEAAAAEGR